MGYNRARALLLLIGLVGLTAIAAVAYLRGVRGPEALVTPLFIPVFVAFVAWGLKGGLAAGVGAAIAYVALRYSAIQTVGLDQIGTTIALRAGGFIAFGLLGGWASRQLEASLVKLDLYDQIDDSTGLYNARFLLQDTDLELTRSQRYQTIFSIAIVEIPASAFEAFSRRQRSAALKELGRILRDSVRTVDRAVHTRTGDTHRLAVVLPETGREGTRIFVDRLAQKLSQYLAGRGASVSGDLTRSALTFPGDEEGITRLLDEFRQVERMEHPGDVSARRGATRE
jgi:GGDEF domain-containing protein